MRAGLLTAALVAVVTMMSGCGAGDVVPGTPLPGDTSSAGSAATPSPAPPPGALSLATTEAGELGSIVTDGSGMTLYRFDKDTAKPPKSVCEEECAVAWPPALLQGTDADLQVGGIDPALVGTVRRTDGTTQLTIAGWPAYYYSKDTEPGHTKGQGADGSCFAFTPDGKKATGTGADTAALTVMPIPELGPVITNAAGMTLYRFNRDEPGAGASACVDGCADVWTPLTVAEGAEVGSEGVTGEVGTIVRDDGRRQVTVDGWPLYQYTGDAVPCDTNGIGADGEWFAVAPNGDKVG